MIKFFFPKSYSIVIISALFFLLSSCITNRDLEYFHTSNGVSEVKVNNDHKYFLQVGDLISVQINTVTNQQNDFFNKEQSSNSQMIAKNPYLYGYLIKEDGFLDLPSLGKIKAVGTTLTELESIIKNIAVTYFEQPIIKLNVINFEISVLGSVNKPGIFIINNPEANVLYALSLANDIKEFGNLRKIKIIRNNNELNRIFYVDLTDLNTLNNTDFMLQPNDVIYVPQLTKRFYSFSSLPNLISMSISAITLYLLINNK